MRCFFFFFKCLLVWKFGIILGIKTSLSFQFHSLNLIFHLLLDWSFYFPLFCEQNKIHPPPPPDTFCITIGNRDRSDACELVWIYILATIINGIVQVTLKKLQRRNRSPNSSLFSFFLKKMGFDSVMIWGGGNILLADIRTFGINKRSFNSCGLFMYCDWPCTWISVPKSTFGMWRKGI